jgi:hypothetical protein
MGFTPEPEILKIVFEKDTSLDGLEIRARCATIREWQQMLTDSGSGPRPAADVAKSNDEVAKKFLSYVLDWNLEFPDENKVMQPAPVSYESWEKFSARQGAIIISQWQRAMTEVPTSSSEESSDGETSLEQLLGMGSELDSLPSWNPPTPS